jgi:ribosomal protein L32E
VVEPALSGELDGFMAYADRHADDGADDRTVTMMTYTEPLSVREMHPAGSEVVICMSGQLELLQEKPDGR